MKYVEICIFGRSKPLHYKNVMGASMKVCPIFFNFFFFEGFLHGRERMAMLSDVSDNVLIFALHCNAHIQ